VLRNIYRREFQLLVGTHLDKQSYVRVYCLFADPKSQQGRACLRLRRIFLRIIRVVLRPRDSNLNFAVCSMIDAYYHEHTSSSQLARRIFLRFDNAETLDDGLPRGEAILCCLNEPQEKRLALFVSER
jgi:hypothetical protein